MRRRALMSLAGSCLLAACAHQTPTAMPGMAWSLHHAEGEGAKLAFGQPASDNVLIMMTCQPRSGEVLVSLAAPSGARPAIDLASRGATAEFQGETAPSMGDGVLIEAQAPASHPALAQFARTGDLTLVDNGRRTPLPARGAERGKIAGFFESCRAA